MSRTARKKEGFSIKVQHGGTNWNKRNMNTLRITTTIFTVLLVASRFALACPHGTKPNGDECIECPPGTFFNDNGWHEPASCEKCSAGHYNPLPNGQTYRSCLECPLGTFSDEGASECTPCPQGKFSRKAFSKCISCPPGSFVGTCYPHSEKCQKCPPAWYRPRHAPASMCLLCPSGTDSRPGARRCKKCEKGTFMDTRLVNVKKLFRSLEERVTIVGDEFVCKECPRNTYTNVKGTVQCDLCPLGMVSGKGAKKCRSCPAGTFRASVKQNNCLPCPEGTTSKGRRPAGCKNTGKGCPVNTFEDNNGECRACMPGERLNVRMKKCVKCGPRQVSRGGVTRKCTTCPRGQRPANSISIFEKSRCECDPGTVSDGIGGCKPCPVGTRWSNALSSDTISNKERTDYYYEPRCEQCQEGFFNNKPGATKCKMCPEGTYADTWGSTSCTKCPEGHVNPAGEPFDKFDDLQGTLSRSTCLQETNGCGIGRSIFVWDDNPYCLIDYCPPNRFLQRDEFHPAFDSCKPCQGGYYLNSTQTSSHCVKCPPGESNPRGTFRNCTIICPKDATVDSNGNCVCSGLYGDDGKGRCKRCKQGEISKQGKCAPCGEDSYFRMSRYGPECRQCRGDTIKLREGHRRCTRCKPGFRKEVDVLGKEVNRCIPAGL